MIKYSKEIKLVSEQIQTLFRKSKLKKDNITYLYIILSPVFSKISFFNQKKAMINDRYYRTFTFVRDPLSRILSAYLDKFNTENKVVSEYFFYDISIYV